jgi:cytochrome c peroxidase
MRLIRVLSFAAAFAIAGCDSDTVGGTSTAPPAEASLDVQVRQAVQQWGVAPLLPVAQQNPALVDLGRSLFFDKILSGNRDVSCATCHDPMTQGGDGRSLAVGTGATMTGSVRVLGKGREFTPRNAPSLFNTGLGMFYMFWDGRVSDEFGAGRFRTPAGLALPGSLSNLLAVQAMLPVTNRVEMRGLPGDRDVFGNANELAAFPDSQNAAIWSAAVRRVVGVSGYLEKFAVAYPGLPPSAIGFEHVANAIAAFEVQAFATKTNSAFDRFLARDNGAMSVEAKRGALLFFGRATCSSCHNGALLGGQFFSSVGVPQIGPGVGGSAPLDAGRDEIFGGPRSGQLFQFRVPPLRNVELTAPYMHNGAYPNLETVLRHYSNVDSAVRSFDASHLDPGVRASYHGDAATISKLLTSVDPRLRVSLRLSPDEQAQIVAFLKSLTDPSARDMSSLVPASVPSGLPVR